MIDGATLNLTTAAIADRNKRAYGTSLPPDEVITNQQELRDRVIAWLAAADRQRLYVARGSVA
jgi:hypothetical protein